MTLLSGNSLSVGLSASQPYSMDIIQEKNSHTIITVIIHDTATFQWSDNYIPPACVC